MTACRRLLLGLVLALAACSSAPSPPDERVALLTAAPAGPNQACPAALAEGVLVADVRSGLALRATTGEVTPVLWPNGFAARRQGATLVLLDPTGRIVAREGETIRTGGGLTGAAFADAWGVCPADSIEVVAPAVR